MICEIQNFIYYDLVYAVHYIYYAGPIMQMLFLRNSLVVRVIKPVCSVYSVVRTEYASIQ